MEENALISHISCCLWEFYSTIVPHQFWYEQGRLLIKARSAINLGNRSLKSANFLWNQGLMLLLRGKGGAAWGRQLHSINRSPDLGPAPPPASPPALPIHCAEGACPPRGQILLLLTLPRRPERALGETRKKRYAWWKFADAKAVFSDTTLHAAVTPVTTDLANFFSRQSSSKMANSLLLYCLPVREWGINEACTCMCTTFVHWESYLSFTFSFIKLLFWQVLAHMLGQFLEVSSI